MDSQNKISCRVIDNAVYHNNRESFSRDAIRGSATVDEGENGITRKRERYRVAEKSSSRVSEHDRRVMINFRSSGIKSERK